MIIFLLTFGFFLYASLYFVWSINQPALYQPISLHSTVADMLFLPQGEIFMILHTVLLITAFYLCADFLISTAKQQIRRYKKAHVCVGPNCPVTRRVETDIEAF